MAKQYYQNNKSRLKVKKKIKKKVNKNDTRSLALAAYKGVKKINAQIEQKYNDLNLYNFYADNDPTMRQILTNIGQGTGDTDRIGDSIFLKKIKLQGRIESTGSGAKQVARLVIIYCKSDTTLTDWDSVFGQRLSTGAPYAFKRWDDRYNTQMLYDKTMTLGEGGNNMLINQTIDVGKIIYYNAGSTTINKGHIYMALCSEDAPTLDTGPQMWLKIRLIYTDL